MCDFSDGNERNQIGLLFGDSAGLVLSEDELKHLVRLFVDDLKFSQEQTKMLGISPEDSGKLKYVKSEQMGDVATANFLIEEIGGKRHVGDMLRTACRELRNRFPHKSDPENQWTERRLRGWWNKESRIVKHFQMVELYVAAEELRAARREHAEYRNKTALIRQMAELVSSHETGSQTS